MRSEMSILSPVSSKSSRMAVCCTLSSKSSGWPLGKHQNVSAGKPARGRVFWFMRRSSVFVVSGLRLVEQVEIEGSKRMGIMP